MAIFGKNKGKDTDKAPRPAKKDAVAKDIASTKKASPKDDKKSAPKTQKRAAKNPTLTANRNLSSILKGPRITEKAAVVTDQNVYIFIVQQDVTKHDIRDAIQEVYNVTPIKIRTVTKKPRRYTSKTRTTTMVDHGMKKAYVYLSKGDSIDFT